MPRSMASNSFSCVGLFSSASFKDFESKETGRAVSQVGPKGRTAPVARSLASVVRKFLLESNLLWSITVRHSRETTIDLILSKASWCSCVQVGKFLSHSFVVSLFKTLLCTAKLGKRRLGNGRLQGRLEHLLRILELASPRFCQPFYHLLQCRPEKFCDRGNLFRGRRV